MANPIKGEVDFPVGEATYRLRLSIEEIIKVEDLLDVGIGQIAASLNNVETMKAGTVRALLWASLQEEHPDVDIVEAGRIMVTAGVTPTMIYLGRVMQAAFPKAEDKETPSPKPGRAGTGKRSLSATSRSATPRKRSGG